MYICVSLTAKQIHNMEPINFFDQFQNESFIKEYGVTEIFVFDGYLYVTSKWDMDRSFYNAIKEKINELGTACEA